MTINAMMRGYLNIKSYIDTLRLYNGIDDEVTNRRQDDISHILASIACNNKGDKKNAVKYFNLARCFNNAQNLDIYKCMQILSLTELYNENKTDTIPASFITTTIKTNILFIL